jgi:outer membrane protein assembly factor BamD (BamD/ComL family)
MAGMSAEVKSLSGTCRNDYQKAITLMKANQLDEAFALFEEIQTKAPQFAGPALNQALIRIQKQNYKEADVIIAKSNYSKWQKSFCL